MADRGDEELEAIRQRLESLPQELLSAVGERPESARDWPELPAPSMPEIGGDPAASLEPVVGRLERVAQTLENRADDKTAGWGTPKMYEQNSLAGLLAQMPVPQAIGFAQQAWATPPGMPGVAHSEDYYADISDPAKQPPEKELPVADLWPSPPSPQPEPGVGTEEILPTFPGAPPTKVHPLTSSPGSPPSRQTHAQFSLPVPSPGEPAGPSILGADGDVSSSLSQEIRQLREAIESFAEKAEQMAGAGGGAASPDPSGLAGSRGQPDNYPTTRPAGPAATPELQPAAVPTWKDAHQGGNNSPWQRVLDLISMRL